MYIDSSGEHSVVDSIKIAMIDMANSFGLSIFSSVHCNERCDSKTLAISVAACRQKYELPSQQPRSSLCWLDLQTNLFHQPTSGPRL